MKLKCLASEIMWDIFQMEDSFVKSSNVISINDGTHAASFDGPRIWDTILEDCQNKIFIKKSFHRKNEKMDS